MKFELIVDPTQEEKVIAYVHSPSELTRQLEELLRSHGQEQGLEVSDCRGTCFLPLGQIQCITVEDRKVYAIYEDGKKYRCNQRLYELEDRLPSCFIRINKSTLANEYCIQAFVPTYSGGVDAVFRCGYRDYVSRRCLAEIRRRLDRK